MRENPYYATYYVFWSKVILMELIPYLFISTLNGFIIAKVFSSYKFRQQFARNSSSRRNSPTNVAQKEPANDVKGKFGDLFACYILKQKYGILYCHICICFLKKWKLKYFPKDLLQKISQYMNFKFRHFCRLYVLSISKAISSPPVL